MYAFFTSGTKSYLESIQDKNPNVDTKLLIGQTNALLYYEGLENIFNSTLNYQLLDSSDSIQDDGFIIMHHIPVPPELEKSISLKLQKILKETDSLLICKKLLFNPKEVTFIFILQSTTKKAYESWLLTDHGEAFRQTLNYPATHHRYQPFTKTYSTSKKQSSSS